MSALPTPVVSCAWLAAHLGEPDLVVVDASWYLPSLMRNPQEEFRAAHIPGAVFWDIDALSDRSSSLPHMLPPPAELAAAVGRLGIGEGDRVVVYDGSGLNGSAPRVWWTLLVLGHDAVTLLDGGLGEWRREGRPLEAGWTPRAPARFASRFRPGLVRSEAELREILTSRSAQILDARSRGRFEGSEPEPRPGLRGGHLPGSRSLPFPELVDARGLLLPPNQLRQRFESAGIDLSRPVVTSCGSGVTACSLALGLARLGVRDFAVYDGSWSEWGRAGGPPVEAGPA